MLRTDFEEKNRAEIVRSHFISVRLVSTGLIIYAFNCSCGAAYIGRTCRSLAIRCREHVAKWLLEGRRGVPRSAITAHLQTCNFDPSSVFNNFSIIYHCRHDRLM